MGIQNAASRGDQLRRDAYALPDRAARAALLLTRSAKSSLLNLPVRGFLNVGVVRAAPVICR